MRKINKGTNNKRFSFRMRRILSSSPMKGIIGGRPREDIVLRKTKENNSGLRTLIPRKRNKLRV